MKLFEIINITNYKKFIAYVKVNGFNGLLRTIKTALTNPLHYDDWFRRHRIEESELESQRNFKFDYNPLISILVPTYNTPEKLLREMLDSVVAQSYSNWQLCIADGSEDKNIVKNIIDEYIKNEKRIVYKSLEKNEGISENTNRAFELADGEFIGLLDHDDLLEPDALFEVVKILQDKSIDVIYTDEDKVMEDLSEYWDPNLKPDFSIDLLRSHNYITHFFVAKKELIDLVGAFRKEFDGAQDYDLILRCVEKANKIAHIAKPLYHWRMCQGSTADDPRSKMYCYDAGKRAIEAHLERCGIKGTVDYAGENLWGLYHVTYETENNPLVSIIIANKDHVSDLKKCIDSIYSKSTYKNIEFVIVENNSEKSETFEYYEELTRKYENVKVVKWEREFNYSAINNFGVSYAVGDYILLLNNDTELISPNAIKEMLGICMRKDVGIVGAKLLYADDTVQHAGVVIGFDRFAGHVFNGIARGAFGFMMRPIINCNYSAVTAACLMTKKTVFDEVAGLTEELAIAGNDVDYCLKVREKNYLVVYNAFSEWYHYESKSRGYENTPEKKARFEHEKEIFRARWAKVLEQGDPYYNKNFPVKIAPFTLD